MTHSSNLFRGNVNVNFNWAYILAFVTFWVYGYYGAISSPNYPLASLLFTILSLATFLGFVLITKQPQYFDDTISFARKDVIVLVSYFALVFVISFKYLLNDITGDELYHIQSTHSHAFTLVTLLSERVSWLHDRASVNVIRLVW